LAHARDLVTFTADGLKLSDGTEIASDLVVVATGYEKQQEAIRRLFGNDIVEKVSEVRGFNVDGFTKNMWTRTCQDHLWIMGGALMEARLYSRFLTLRIKADLEGL
jgi:hypothetical protein